jgi:hypothetical protein
MSYFKGIRLSGLNIRVQDTFNSVPGLMQFNYMPELLTMYDAEKVSTWGDKSNFPNPLKNLNPDRMPVLENNLWLKSESNLVSLSAPYTDYRFLHNGSRFGVYSLMKNTLATSGTVTANSPFRTGSNAATGLVLTISNTSSGRFQASIRGGATVPTKEVSGFMNPASPNFTANSSIVITSCVNLGQTLGVIMRYGNAQATLSPFFTTTAQYPTGQNGFYIALQGQAGMTVREGILLIYDWTNYSREQAQGFDLQVMGLLNAERIKFQNLDI